MVFLVEGIDCLCSINLKYGPLIPLPIFLYCHSSYQLFPLLHFIFHLKNRDLIKLLISALLFAIWLCLKPIAPEENTALAKQFLQTPPDCTVLMVDVEGMIEMKQFLFWRAGGWVSLSFVFLQHLMTTTTIMRIFYGLLSPRLICYMRISAEYTLQTILVMTDEAYKCSPYIIGRPVITILMRENVCY